MALVEQGILGGYRGKVGGVVGYWRMGQWCVRAYRAHINDARSALQLVQRSQFKAMILFAAAAKGALRQGLRQGAQDCGLTEGNLFLRLNHRHFRQRLEGGPVEVDYAGLQFSRGGMGNVDFEGATTDDGRCVTVRYGKNQHGQRTKAEDRVVVYAYCPAMGTGLVVESRRGRKQAQFLLPDSWVGCEVQLWGFTVNAQGEASNSAYIGPLAPEGSAFRLPAEEATQPTPSRNAVEDSTLPHGVENLFSQVKNSS